MPKVNSHTIVIELPEDYYTTLTGIAKDETRIAERKWNNALTQEQKDTVLFHSFKQLKNAVSKIIGHQWDPESSQYLNVKVNTAPGVTPAGYTLDGSDSSTLPGMRIARSGNSYAQVKSDRQEIDGEVMLKDFRNHCLAFIEKSLRTAVMYGVGSYETRRP